jgi:hypothetical protein
MRITSSEIGVIALVLTAAVAGFGAREHRLLAHEGRLWDRRAALYEDVLALPGRSAGGSCRCRCPRSDTATRPC